MGQKSLNFSVSKCIRAQFNSDICKETDQTAPNYCKSGNESEWKGATIRSQQRRNSTEEISRWINRFAKAKIASRKQQDLRREVLLHNAFIRAQTEIKIRQEERQKRWKELKPLFRLETTYVTHSAELNGVKMAAVNDKMATAAYKMAADDDDSMEVERPSTPLPALGAVKRNRCGCSPLMKCFCSVNNSSLSKKFRPAVAADDEDEDLKSLDQFLSSLHCNSRQVG